MPHTELSHGTLHYRESGAGAPVVFLAAILPRAQLEVIADSRTWVMLDQPERAAELIAAFVRRATAQQAA